MPFLAFTAIFAVLAAFVFHGTWALGVVPIMPDCATTFPVDAIGDFIARWRESGKFVPGDLLTFLGSQYIWVEFQFVLAAYCAALGLAYYCRGRGLSRIASLGAGLLLAFCGYWFSLYSAGHLGWFRWMTYGVFAFGLADRAVRKGKLKNWILLGACVAWGSFYQPDLWLLFTFLTAAYFIWCCVRERRFICLWKGLIVCAATFFIIAAPSLRGAAADKARRDSDIAEAKESGSVLTGGETTDDAQARWIFVTNWSLPPAETLEFVWPRINGDTSCPMVLALGAAQGTGVTPYTGALGRPIDATAGNYRQHSLYVGLVTCLLALAGLAMLSKRGAPQNAAARAANRADIGFWLAAGVLCYLLSLGRNFEALYRLVFALPIGDSIRAPVKWHHLTEFCICALAAYGIDSLLALLREKLGVACAVSLVAVAIVAGACDLARIDRLYCAGHTADTQVGPLPRPMPKDPAAAAQFRQAVARSGFKFAGVYKTPDGYELPMVEQKTPRPKSHVAENPMTGFTLALAWLSLAATALTACCGLKRFRNIRI